MADRKISDLTALTTPASGDYLPIVDISEASAANKNKRITIEELLRGAPNGTAGAPGIGFESDPNTGIYSPGADALGLVTAGAERLRIISTGLVGIGTTSPSYALDVSGQIRAAASSTLAQLRLERTDSGAGHSWLGAQSDALLAVLDSSFAEKMRLDSSGRLLVGTSLDSGGALLQVNGNRIRVATAKTPSSASDSGTAGEICWDADYIYVCTATNTWKRTAISTWP